MCGIAGVATGAGRGENSSRVRTMLGTLAHRGPDAEGVYEDGEICLGHRRLSIIDLSEGGRQPMVDSRNAVVFNGEIYNHRALRRELEAQGIAFQSRSDTEVLLRGYGVWGPDVVRKIRGMFAFALWDDRLRTLFCARDPFGKKPFYFSWLNREFVFASEIEALAAGLAHRPEMDESGLAHYLLKGYYAPGKSVYGSVETLGAGCCVELEPGSGAMRQWPYWEQRFRLGGTDTASIDDCGSRVGNAVAQRLESDVPMGALLSGGVDSSLVCLKAAEQLPSRLRTFTAAFEQTGYDETKYARQVASRAGAEQIEIPVRMESVPEMLRRLVRVYGEPFGDYSAIPAYSLFEGLKPHVKVALTGDGGDELFAGYHDTRLFLMRQALAPLAGSAAWVPGPWMAALLSNPSRSVRKIGYAVTALRPSGGEAFLSLYSEGWTAHWRKQLMRPEAWRRTGESGVESDFRGRFDELGRNDLERYLNLLLERLTQSYLVKIDRASMAHSIEARCPMLDADLFAWTRELAQSVLLRRGEPKSLLKDCLDRYMGRGFSRRKKMGFTPPLSAWLREPQAVRWVEERLTDRNSLAYSLFSPEAIRRLLHLHAGHRNHVGRIWKLLFLNEWHGSVSHAAN